MVNRPLPSAAAAAALDTIQLIQNRKENPLEFRARVEFWPFFFIANGKRRGKLQIVAVVKRYAKMVLRVQGRTMVADVYDYNVP